VGWQDETVTLIYLVQHGDKERTAGDPGLTELGTQQAAATAWWLKERGIRALYSSPLRRAQQTAAAIAGATQSAVQLDIRLRERWNWEDRQRFDAFLTDWDRSTRDRDFVLSNGESSRSVGDRMRAFLGSLTELNAPVAAVSHGGATTDLLRTLLGDDLFPALLGEGVPACAITTLNDLDVIAIASTGHLA
jgi:broad specificity phosphatase PhoE